VKPINIFKKLGWLPVILHHNTFDYFVTNLVHFLMKHLWECGILVMIWLIKLSLFSISQNWKESLTARVSKIIPTIVK
jgi:hypothetical protein